MTPILIEIGPGELCDRLSILTLKAERVKNGRLAASIGETLERLRRLRHGLPFDAVTARLEADLAEVNRHLWEVEDALHAAESREAFDDAYIALARRVQQLNRRRCGLKAAIDEALEMTGTVEVKIYGK